MRAFLVNIYHSGVAHYHRLKWEYDTWRLRMSFKRRCPEFSLIKGKYLVLIPHADDEWVGCSQLVGMKEAGVTLINMDMSGDDKKDIHLLRRQELCKTACTFNRCLELIESDKVSSLCKYITYIQPDYICLPYWFDWHPEHIAVMQMLSEAMNKIAYTCNILMYQVSLPILPGDFNCWITMNMKEWKQKWGYFENTYPSQTIIPYKRFACNERINGAIAGDYAAEVYMVLPSGVWMSLLPQSLLDDFEKAKIQSVLFDIRKTRDLLYIFGRKRKNKE